MNPPVVTALYAGLNALILVWLIVKVVGFRKSLRVTLGDGGDQRLGLVVRAHGNAAETIPIALILLALTEMMGAPAAVLHAAGLLLTTGRLAHALHFVRGGGAMRLRVFGMAATIAPIVVMALGLIIHAIARMAV